jgi:hypothetical protein
MESGYPQPDIDFAPELVIGAALLAPGFSEDLSTWRMTIKSDGTALQELHPSPYSSDLYDRVVIHLRSWVNADRIALIQRIADEIGFGTFNDQFHADSTDLQTTSITVNQLGRPKRVVVYGPQQLAYEGDSRMIGYMRLWELMLEISPYRETEANSQKSCPRIYADFHNVDAQGQLRLNCRGTLDDLHRQGIILSQGLAVTLYSEDVEVEGEVQYSGEESIWVAQIDWNARTSDTSAMR